MAINVPALAVVLVFYAIIVIVGILAAYKLRNRDDATGELSVIAGRNLGMVVGVFTMTATSVGGGYLAGTTEGIVVYGGIAWTIYPFTILIAFTLGSILFAKPMRSRQYLTLLDPLQERFGDFMTGLLLLVSLFAELLWGASILIALGSSLSIIVEIDQTWALCLSAAVALVYTVFGQMVSVAYTDIVQLCLIALGMTLCVPYAVSNPLVAPLSNTSSTWVGTIEAEQGAQWADFFLSQVLGGIPWNTYMMRILAAKSVMHAQVVSVAGGIFGFLFAIPPAVLGMVALSTDWNSTDYGKDPVEAGDSTSLLPLVIQNLTPPVIGVIALAAIVSAVMSSMDSIILSSSSMFTHNIYKLAFRNGAGPRELKIVQAVSMLVITVIVTVMALFVNTIFGIFILTADIVYVVLFPQFVCAVFIPFTNAYGSFAGYAVGAILRFGGGEPSLNLKPFINYPYSRVAWDGVNVEQLFPFKTVSMLCSFVTILIVSGIVRWLFRNDVLPSRLDITKRVVTSVTVTEYSSSKTLAASQASIDDVQPKVELMAFS